MKHICLLAVLIVPLCGCSTVAKVAKELKDDPAIIVAKIGTPWGRAKHSSCGAAEHECRHRQRGRFGQHHADAAKMNNFIQVYLNEGTQPCAICGAPIQRGWRDCCTGLEGGACCAPALQQVHGCLSYLFREGLDMRHPFPSEIHSQDNH